MKSALFVQDLEVNLIQNLRATESGSKTGRGIDSNSGVLAIIRLAGCELNHTAQLHTRSGAGRSLCCFAH